MLTKASIEVGTFCCEDDVITRDRSTYTWRLSTWTSGAISMHTTTTAARETMLHRIEMTFDPFKCTLGR